LITVFRFGKIAGFQPLRSPMLLPFALVLMLLVGCGGTSKPQVGPIEFTSTSGASETDVTSLAVNGQVHLVATVKNDNQFLGVSWTVTCGSAASSVGTSIDTSCGTFNPAQTASGPVPSYSSTGIITTYTAPSTVPKGSTVTITAHATALPSETSSITLTIVAAEADAKPGPMTVRKAPRMQAVDLENALPVAGSTGRAPSSEL